MGQLHFMIHQRLSMALSLALVGSLAASACETEVIDNRFGGAGGAATASSSGTGGSGNTGAHHGGAGGAGLNMPTSSTTTTVDICVDCIQSLCAAALDACFKDASCIGTDCSCCAAPASDGDCPIDELSPESAVKWDTLVSCVCIEHCAGACSESCSP